MNSRFERLAVARLYLVCDVMDDGFLSSALRGGVQIVQLRSKHGDTERIRAAAARYRELCGAHDALLIINDDPALAAAVDADGVHVGQDDMPVARARSLVGEERIVGLSTHSPAQVEAAKALDVDYIGVGPVHATPTKPGRPAVGTELVAYAAAHAHVPFFAIGGVDTGNVGSVLSAGATRIAVVRALTDADDPEAVARTFQTCLSGQEAGVGTA